MKALHLMPLVGSILVGLGVALLSQHTSLWLGLGIFAVVSTIVLSLVGTLYLLVVCFFMEADR